MKYGYVIRSCLVTIVLVSMIISATSIYQYTKLFSYLNSTVATVFIYVMALKYFKIKEKEGY